ncbi:CocE/NonD family hydrolase [Leeuwenhoekiella sp. A16]|uniref:CocE/NonD family hydrolase n=1 Tax=unclassified Leeuwenhoekiella TaxID=2615029 RepID=UPI003A811FFB
MKNYLKLLVLFAIVCCFNVQAQDLEFVKSHYDKQEVKIKMRDGILLHTTIYSPKDKSKKYPILMMRTPYSCQPYGENVYKNRIGPNKYLVEEGNIFVQQDVRGRWNSEGTYDNMRPYIPNKKGKQTDEASDTYDTIDWLVKNVDNNNGNVGIWGISYPGFYATYALLSEHPALKAVSPQACISDFFFDDFHHNGAFLESYWRAISLFGYMKDEPVKEAWYKFPDLPSEDQYQFFLDEGPLTNLDKYYKEDNIFWQQFKDHPNYDEFWQSRGIIQYLKDIKPAVMIVGGLFDAEDLYGPFNTYEKIEETSKNYNTIVYGPWSHGDWARDNERQAIGNVYFGDNISRDFQQNVETKFFNHFLKEGGKGESGLPEAMMYDTGKREWETFTQWPPKAVTQKTFYLGEDQELATAAEPDFENTFISDPQKPVPYSEDIKMVFTPRKYMTDDQRFAARRPDVLVYETEVLDEDMTLSGDIMAKLQVATTGTDADWVVKVIDVYPPDAPDYEETQKYLKMGNYFMMVRSEVMRGRFRESFTDPKPFEPNTKTPVTIKLQDVNHTFLKGHKMQIQVQSTWFPLIDRNPQTFVPNIYKAKAEDFKKQTHTIYGDSAIEFSVLKP